MAGDECAHTGGLFLVKGQLILVPILKLVASVIRLIVGHNR